MKQKVKAKLLQPLSTDAGSYIGLRNVNWEEKHIAEGILKDKALILEGSEFIKIGGDADVFKPKVKYIWGSYEIIEEGGSL